VSYCAYCGSKNQHKRLPNMEKLLCPIVPIVVQKINTKVKVPQHGKTTVSYCAYCGSKYYHNRSQ
jgi:uncharacterized OB-fold protein